MTIRDPLWELPLDWRAKGISNELLGCRAGELTGVDESVFGGRLFYPVAILKESVVRSNSAWMRTYLSKTGVKLAPHGKTTMAPDLFKLQMSDGAWAMTAATAQHVRAYRKFGVSRIILANQLFGTGAIDWIASEINQDDQFDFYCLVDSAEGAHALAAGAARNALKRPFNVLIESGRRGGRAGVRSVEEGALLAAECAKLNGLHLAGVETFEGIVQTSPNPEPQAGQMLDQACEIAARIDAEGLFKDRILLTAGGSAFFDEAARKLSALTLSRPVEIVIRSGCYLIHDHGLYANLFTQLRKGSRAMKQGIGLQPALEVWGLVQSHPEPGRWICGIGRRDIALEEPPPSLIAWAAADAGTRHFAPPGYAVSSLFDQHMLLDGPTNAPFKVGDFLGFGVSHPCTTFDKWQSLFWVDDDYKVSGVLRTYF